MQNHPESVFTSSNFKVTFRLGLLSLLVFEMVSLLGFFLPPVSSLAFLVLIFCVAVLAWKRPDLALLVLLGELFIGSQGGAMVAYSSGGTFVSLRIGLFLAVFGVWLAKSLIGYMRSGFAHSNLAWFLVLREKGLFWPYIALLSAFAYGGLRGLALNSSSEVFFDANGYAYFALLPAFHAAFLTVKDKDIFRTNILALLFAAITDAVLKALIVLFLFSHRQFGVAWNLYLWVRDTRVGEITIMTADFYRIFFQSQIWSLAMILAGSLYAAYMTSWKTGRARAVLAIITWAMVAMALSLSRSFWFGGAVAAIICAAFLVWAKAEKIIWARLLAIGVGSILCAVVIILTLYIFPFPRKTGDLSFMTLFSSRATSFGDAAASSRWALLPKLMEAGREHPVLGSGLGRSVTYTTSDPRLLADNPTGKYTTSAFEWGYHDLWIKFGLFGLVAYGWFVLRLLKRLLRNIQGSRLTLAKSGLEQVSKEQTVIYVGLVVAVVALLATNVFSPYLNHPLGIGLLMLVTIL